jgi:hypothetical protein
MKKALALMVIAGLVAVMPSAPLQGQTAVPLARTENLPAIAEDSCTGQRPGDANSDGKHNVGDYVFLARFLCEGGPAPVPLLNGDFNGDCVVDSLDAAAAFDYVWKCRNAEKCDGRAPVVCTCMQPQVGDFFHDPCFGALAGDANDDLKVNVGDAVYMVNRIFKGGYAPQPIDFLSGDANSDCTANVGDVVYIVNYVFKDGPPPPDCHAWIQSCGRCEELLFRWWMNPWTK